MDKKFYSEKQIYASAFFGGPIPPGILIYKNLKRLGDSRKASLSLFLTFLFSVLVFYGIMQLPDSVINKIPNFAFTAFYTIIVYFLYHKFLSNRINENLISGENKISNWNVAGFTFFGLIINIIIGLGIAFSQPTFPGEKMTFGNLNHEVFYDSEDVTENEVRIIAKELTYFGYFQDEFQQAVRIERHKSLELILPIQKEFWEDELVIQDLNNMKSNMEIFLNQKIKIILTHYDFNGKTQTKTL